MFKNRFNRTEAGTSQERTSGAGRRARSGRRRGIRAFALILAITLALTSADFSALGRAVGGPIGSFVSSLFEGSGPKKAHAALSSVQRGDIYTFADILPVTETHIDINKLTNPQVDFTPDSNFIISDGKITYVGSKPRNDVVSFSGTLATFTFKDAAILSDRTTADVVITYFNPTFYFGRLITIRKINGKDTAIDYDADGSLGAQMQGEVRFLNTNGRDINAGVYNGNTSPSWIRWYVGIELGVNVKVTGANGDIIYGLTGMTNSREGLATYATIAQYLNKNYFSEQAQIDDGAVTTPIYAPQQDYGAGFLAGSSLIVVGRGGHPSTIPDSTAAVPASGQGGLWDYSFLTGFITEGDGATGVNNTLRLAVGTNNGASQNINSSIMRVTPAYMIDTSTTPGGKIEFTKDGNASGLLDDGSDILGPGVYSVPRGKTITITMTPDNNEYYPRTIKAGKYGSSAEVNYSDVTKHTKADGSVYYTYTFNQIMEDKEIWVEWAPIPAEVDATKSWVDNNNANKNRVGLELTMLNNSYLPSQEITKTAAEASNTQQVKWGSGAGYTAKNGTTVYKDYTQHPDYKTDDGNGNAVTYWYNNATLKWDPYINVGERKIPAAATGLPSLSNTDFLPKYNANGVGELIDYTVDSAVVETPNPPTGYTLSKSYTSANATAAEDPKPGTKTPDKAKYDWTLTNTEELASIDITKTWRDEDYYTDNKFTAKKTATAYTRPDLTYEIKATAGGTDVTSKLSASQRSITLTGPQTGTNVWKMRVSGLPVYVNGIKVQYEVKEVQPAGYVIETANPQQNLDPYIIREVVTETTTTKTASYDPATDTSTVVTRTFVVKTTTTYSNNTDTTGTTTSETTSSQSTATVQGRVSNSSDTVTSAIREWGEKADFSNKPEKTEDEFKPIDLIIKKTERGSATGTGLEGAEFNLFNTDSFTPNDYMTDTQKALLGNGGKTDSDGVFTLTFKKPGTYYLAETKAPKGYELDVNNRWTIVVNQELTEIKLVNFANPESSGISSSQVGDKLWQWVYELIFGGSAAGSTATITTETKTETDPVSGDTTMITTHTMSVTDPVKRAALTATKTWDDAQNQDGRRPAAGSEAKFTLQQKVGDANWSDVRDVAGNKLEATVSSVNNAAKFTVKVFENLPVYKDGEKIKYRVVESAVTDYETTYEAADGSYQSEGAGVYLLASDEDTAEAKSIDVKNKYTPKTTKLIIKKIWNDGEYYTGANFGAKKDGTNYVRPAVTFDIAAWTGDTNVTDEAIPAAKRSLTLDGAQTGTGTWTDEITDLPVYWNGEQVSYRVTERQPEAYTKDAAVTATPEEKTDANTGNKYYEATAEISNTPVGTEAYAPITLTIKKVDSKTAGTAGLAGAEFGFFTDAQAETPVPAGSSAPATVSGPTGTDGTTTLTFNRPGTYYIKETQAPTGYEASDTVYTIVVEKDDNGLQSITKVSGGDESSGSKVWQWLYSLLFGSINPNVEWNETSKTLTVKNDPVTADITLAKTWDDKNNQDGKREPAVLTLERSLNDGQSWNPVKAANGTDNLTAAVGTDYADKAKTTVTSFTGLPAYEDGVRVKYRVVETGQDADYTVTYDAADEDYNAENGGAYIARPNGTQRDITLAVYNQYTPKQTELKIIKTWSDGEYYNDAASFDAKKDEGYVRPKLSFVITANNGTQDVTSMLSDAQKNVELDGAQTGTGVWETTITGLPKYANGELITYTVTETATAPAGFMVSPTGGISAVYDESSNIHTARVTNSPVKTESFNAVEMTVRKVDKLTQGGLSNALFKLYSDSGFSQEITDTDIAEISGPSGSDGRLTVTFKKAGTYYLKEEAAPKGYVLNNANRWTIVVEEDLKSISLIDDAANGASSGGKVWQWLYDLLFTGVTQNTTWDAGSKTLTVENEPLKADLAIKKNWVDNQNQDGLRADSLVTLYKKVGDGAWVKVQENSADKTAVVNKGEDDAVMPLSVATWNLPAYENGQLVLYRVEENAVSGYSTSYSDNDGEGVDLVADPEAESVTAQAAEITVTNTHTPAVAYIKLVKRWSDHNNQDGKRPESLTFNLSYNDGTAKQLSYTMPEGTGAGQLNPGARDNAVAGEYTWLDNGQLMAFPVYANGQPIAYTLTETAVTGYTTTYTGTDEAKKNQNFTLTPDRTYEVEITNTHEPETTKIIFTKTWVDDSNKWDNRPTKENYFTQLILTANAPVIIPSAATSMTGGDTDPTYVYTWDGLQKYKTKQDPAAAAELVEYTVQEIIGLLTGYTTDEAKVTGSAEDGTIEMGITNTLTRTSLSVTKTWDDAGDQDGFRNAVGAGMKLYVEPEDGSGTKTLYDTTGLPQTVTTADNWAYTWENLPVYINGKLAKYSVEEEKTGAHKDDYATSYTGNGRVARAGATAGTVGVTNRHVPETVDIVITKTWDDAEFLNAITSGVNEYQRPESITVTITGKITPDGAAEAVTVDSLTRTATITGNRRSGTTWTHTEHGLPKYHEGKAVTYSITETTPETYTKSGEGLDMETLAGAVTNKPEKSETTDNTTIILKKTDANTGHGIAGGVFTVTKEGGAPVELTSGTDGTVSHTFTEEGVYTIAEKTAPEGYIKSLETFTVTVRKELTSITKLTPDLVWKWLYSLIKTVNGGQEASFDTASNTITYPNAPERGHIRVTKIWDDNSNQDGVRPNNVNFTISATVDNGATDVTALAIAAAANREKSLNSNNPLAGDTTGNSWSDLIQSLPVYVDGKKVTYTVTEDLAAINTSVTHGTNYVSSWTDNKESKTIAKDAETVFEVTNSREPEQTKITINKIWDDAKYLSGDAALQGVTNNYTRPDISFTVSGVANSAAVTLPAGKDSLTLSGETAASVTQWSGTVEGLPVYAGGYPINYKVEENQTNPTQFKYEISQSLTRDANGNYTVSFTNTPVEETKYTPTTMTIRKTDSNTGNALNGGVFMVYQADGTTPATQGDTDDKQVAHHSITIGAGGTAEVVFKQPGTYIIKETTPPTGYQLSTAEYTVVVDEQLTSVTLAGSTPDVWRWLYGLLFKNEEIAPAANWNADRKTLTVPNDPQTASLTVYKRWRDNDNQDQKRAAEIDFTLDAVQNNAPVPVWGTESSKEQKMTGINTVINDNLDAGYTVFANLPIYRDGQKITYKVTETVPAEYTASYENGANTAGVTLNADSAQNRVTVTNIYNPRAISIQVKKVWEGDTESRRGPASVYLYRSVEGAAGETRLPNPPGHVTAQTASGDTVVTFTDLPVYLDGKKITYRVEETQVSGYEEPAYSVSYKDSHTGEPVTMPTGSLVAENIFNDETRLATVTITNTALIDVTVTKIWKDGANANVELKLFRYKSTGTSTSSALEYTQKTSALDNGDGTLKVSYWTPYDTDGTTLLDGWEEVPGAVHTFVADHFANSPDGDDETHTFTNLPRYWKDGEGNRHEYTYRVLETTQRERFEADQTGELEVTNTNIHKDNGVAHINVVKELSGRRWIDSDEFFFKIEAVNGKNITTNTDVSKDDVPLPRVTQGTTVTDKSVAHAVESNTEVGALGRAVTFTPIEYTTADVPMGETVEFNYVVYEVADEDGNPLTAATDDKGITYAADETSTATAFVPKKHKLKVVAINDNGKIGTTLYWGDEQSSDVPVFTNTYDATGMLNAYVIKRIDGRNYLPGDSFDITVINVAGSVIRRTPDGAGITQSQDSARIATVKMGDTAAFVTADSGNYLLNGQESGDTMAMKTEMSNYFKLSDLSANANGPASGTFIYELIEDAANSAAQGNDLTFDKKRVYLKADVTDNEDGTLKIETSYFLDAACTMPLQAKVLVSKANGSLASADTAADAEGYELVPAAFFENEKFAEITVNKIWVDEDGGIIEPADNAVVRLNRYKVADLANPGDLPENIDLWEAAQTHTFDRGQFYTATINGVTYTQTEAARKVANGEMDQADFAAANWSFNSAPASYTFTDLPLHTIDANGNDMWYIYRVREATGSEAFEASYQVTGEDPVASWTQTGNMRDKELTITNKVKASNTAYISAVKQLMGRDWLTSLPLGGDADRYDFELIPLGVGAYDENGDLIKNTLEDVENGYRINGVTVQRISNDDFKKNGTAIVLPNMPERSQTAGLAANLARATKADAVVGEGERLARFGDITYQLSDLSYDPTDGHMQGDFFYLMKEVIPSGATPNADGSYTYKGVTYDGTVHTVHVKVRENRTANLTVQVAYDEQTVGDISSGTQFTPVFTNHYDAEGTQDAPIRKYIMGRGWQDGDSFTFTAMPLGGAPFVDENGDVIRGSVEITMTKDDLVSGKAYLEKLLPKLNFALSDLHWVTGANGAKDPRGTGISPIVYFSDRVTPVPEGTSYGRFIYAVSEKTSTADMIKDPDTEYVQITAIDKGDGTLDTYIRIFEDRYNQHERKASTDDGLAPYTIESMPARAITFVNQLKRDLTVTKTWTAAAAADVILRLEWSIDGTNWTPADGTSWLSGMKTVQTIDKNAEGTDLTVTFENLPAYVNNTGNDIDLDDAWVFYRVVEDPIDHVTTYYKAGAYEQGDDPAAQGSGYSEDPVSTETERKGDGSYYTPAERVQRIAVVNVPADLEGRADVHVVKQLTGRDWRDSDEFIFRIEATGGTRGDGSSVDPADVPMPVKRENNTETETDTAKATTRTAPVSENEYNAPFDPIFIKLSDLAYDSATKTDRATFTYKITEVAPEGAETITEGGVEYFLKNNIRYTKAEHTVTILAVNDGSGTINTTVSYDDRSAGDFIPVFTNIYVMKPELDVTKVWDDSDNAERRRPASVTIKLFEFVWNTEEERYVKTAEPIASITLNGEADDEPLGTGIKIQERTAAGSASWTGRFSELPMTKNGRNVLYVVEEDVTDAATYAEPGTEGKYSNKPVISGNPEEGYTVTNTYEPLARVYVKATKVWDDAGIFGYSDYERTGLRFTLSASAGGTQLTYAQLGLASEADLAKTIAADAEGDGLSVIWTGLPRYYHASWANNDKTEITYSVTETAADGSALAGWVITGGTLSPVNDPNTGDKEGYETTFTNIPITRDIPDDVSLTIKKVDAETDTGVGLAGAEFKVYQSNGESMAITSGPDAMVNANTLTTDAEGKAYLTFVQPGIYVIRESKAPVGYYLNERSYIVQVDNDLRIVNFVDGDNVWELVYQMLFNVNGSAASPVFDAAVGLLTVPNDPIKGEVLVIKTWDDAEDQDGLRAAAAAAAKVRLLRKNGDNWVAAADKAEQAVPAEGGKISSGETYTWNDVVAYIDGVRQIYKVEETGTLTGYTTSVTLAGGDGEEFAMANADGTAYDNMEVTVTNTHVPATTRVIVNKIWNDNEDAAGLRAGVNAVINLYKQVGSGLKQPVALDIPVGTGTPGNEHNWSHVFEDLPAYENGELIKYYVEEVLGSDDYTKWQGTEYLEAVPGEDAGIIVISNTVKRSIDITKIWRGSADADVMIRISTDDGEVQTLTFPADEFTFAADAGAAQVTKTTDLLPVYDEDFEPIEYKVEEITTGAFTTAPSAAQTVTLEEAEQAAVTITNTSQAVFSVSGVKIWIDPKTAAGEDHDTENAALTLTLNRRISGGEAETVPYVTDPAATEGVVLTWDGDAYHFAGAPEFDANGNPYTYWVTEAQVSGYDAPVYKNAAGETVTEGAPDGGSITNRITQETLSISVTKQWEDEGNRDGFRPERIELYLYRDDTLVSTAVIANTLDGNSQSVTFTADSEGGDLPRYAEDGHEYEYLITEDPAVSHRYSSSYLNAEGDSSDSWTGAPNGGTIVNTYEPETVTITASKLWEHGDNPEASRPEAKATLALQRRIAGGEWEFVKPDGVSAAADESEAWSVTLNNTAADNALFENLPLNAPKDAPADETKAYEYRIYELNVPEKYSQSGGTEAEDYQVTNTYIPETITLPATKIWSDNGNQDGTRPESVTLRLLANRMETEFTVTLSAADAVAGEPNVWTKAEAFVDVPKYQNGEEISYALWEDGADEMFALGYMPDYTQAGADGGYRVTNVLDPEDISLGIFKVWDDMNDQDGLRPENIIITIKRQAGDTPAEVMTALPEGAVMTHLNGDPLTIASNGEITLAVAADTGLIISGLPRKDNGRDIVYTVEEKTVEGYTTAYEGSSAEGYLNIINSHTPLTRGIEVFKTWDDADDQDGLRRESRIYLERKIGEGSWEFVPHTTHVTVPGENKDEAFASWGELPAYQNGEEVSYRVVEEGPDGYTIYYSVNGAAETTTAPIISLIREDASVSIINRHAPAAGSLKLIKSWEDDENAFNLRPASVSVTITAKTESGAEAKVFGDSATKGLFLTAENSWTDSSLSSLPLFYKGEKVLYSAAENNIPAAYLSVAAAPAALTADGETELSIVNVLKQPASGTDKTTVGLKDEGQELDLTQMFTTGDGDISSYLIKDPADGQYKSTVDVPGVGTYTIDEGKVKFTPAEGYTGTADPVTIRAIDENGLWDEAAYTVQVVETLERKTLSRTITYTYVNDEGKLVADERSQSVTVRRLPQEVDPATGDVIAWGPWEADDTATNNQAVTSPDQSANGWTPAEASVAPISGEELSALLDDANSGDADALAALESGTLPGKTIVYTAQEPVGGDAVSYGMPEQPQTKKLEFALPTKTHPVADKQTEPNEIASMTLLDAGGNPVGNSLTVPGKGTYTLNPSTGEISFTPADGFVGTADKVTVRATDKNGLSGTATYQPQVLDGTLSKTVTRTVEYTYAHGPGGSSAEPVKDAGGQVVRDLQEVTLTMTAIGIDNNGNLIWPDRWTVSMDALSTTAKDPLESRNGYTDNQSGHVPAIPLGDDVLTVGKDANGQPTAATKQNKDYGTVNVVYTPNAPSGQPARSVGGTSQPQKTKVNISAAPGTMGPGYTPNRISSYKLMDGATPVNSLTVPGEGTYAINPETGEVTFTPEDGFTGTAGGVTVRGTDLNGKAADIRYTPEVVERVQTKTVSRTIHYVNQKDGTTVFTDYQDEKTFTAFGRVKTDPVTGNPVLDADEKPVFEWYDENLTLLGSGDDIDWSKSGVTKELPAVPSAAKSHYHADQPTVPASQVGPASGDIETTVYYTPVTYTVKFDPNGGNGSMPDQTMTWDEMTNLAPNAFTRGGHVYTGWNTAPNGSGDPKRDQENVLNFVGPDDSVITLYAQWRAKGFTVWYTAGYDGAPNIGVLGFEDAVPYGSNPTPPANPTRPGHDFLGYTVKIQKEDGSVDEYTSPVLPAELPAVTGHMLATAQWKAHDYTITYDTNGANETMDPQTFNGRDRFAITRAGELTREGYEFTGFKATDKDGNPVKDAEGNDLILTKSEDVIKYLQEMGDGCELKLTAQWKVLDYTEEYSYKGAYPSAVMDTLPTRADRYENGATVTAAQPAATEVVVPGGRWTFKGWDKESDVVNTANVRFSGTWQYTADPLPECPTCPSVTPTSPVDPGCPDCVNPTTPATKPAGCPDCVNPQPSEKGDVPPYVPDMGDTSNVPLWAALTVSSLLGCAIVIGMEKKRRKED